MIKVGDIYKFTHLSGKISKMRISDIDTYFISDPGYYIVHLRPLNFIKGNPTTKIYFKILEKSIKDGVFIKETKFIRRIRV